MTERKLSLGIHCLQLNSIVCLIPQTRGDEEVQPNDDEQDNPSPKAVAGDTQASMGGSAVASGAPGDAKRRALEPSEAAGSDSIRQSAPLQGG